MNSRASVLGPGPSESGHLVGPCKGTEVADGRPTERAAGSVRVPLSPSIAGGRRQARASLGVCVEGAAGPSQTPLAEMDLIIKPRFISTGGLLAEPEYH